MSDDKDFIQPPESSEDSSDKPPNGNETLITADMIRNYKTAEGIIALIENNKYSNPEGVRTAYEDGWEDYIETEFGVRLESYEEGEDVIRMAVSNKQITDSSEPIIRIGDNQIEELYLQKHVSDENQAPSYSLIMMLRDKKERERCQATASRRFK